MRNHHHFYKNKLQLLKVDISEVKTLKLQVLDIKALEVHISNIQLSKVQVSDVQVSKGSHLVFQEADVVTTLTLGSRPRQKLARVRAKREARESHLMFLGM